MKLLNHEMVKNNGWLVLECITGSKSYNLNTANSDTDIRGVFVLPKEWYYSIEYVPQVTNETNDIVYYELKRFIELLLKNNPNIIELLNTPSHCILQKHLIMDNIRPETFLSKLCEKTFAQYAFTQIKKAYGLEKKILNPIDKERKSVVDFCYIYNDEKSVSLREFITNRKLSIENIGLAAVPHLKDCYNAYYSETNNYLGLIRNEDVNDVCTSNIPKGEKAIGLLYFNKDGYSNYCKQHKEYWAWVTKRNEARYEGTMQHGKKYDAKNMMHVFRLLKMAEEIATEGIVNVWRTDRDFLLDIKAGKFEYDDLVTRAEKIHNDLPALFANANLPIAPDEIFVNDLLVKMRMEYYDKK